MVGFAAFRRRLDVGAADRGAQAKARLPRAGRVRHRGVRRPPGDRAGDARAPPSGLDAFVRGGRACHRVSSGPRLRLGIRRVCRRHRADASTPARGSGTSACRACHRRRRRPRDRASGGVALRARGPGPGRAHGACGPVGRGPAVREHERGEERRVLFGRNHRGSDQRARQRRRAPGRLAHFGVRLQEQEPQRPPDRRGAGRRHRAGGERPARRQRAAAHRPADQRRGRIPPLVEDIRPGAEERLRGRGRAGALHRRRAPAQAPQAIAAGPANERRRT